MTIMMFVIICLKWWQWHNKDDDDENTVMKKARHQQGSNPAYLPVSGLDKRAGPAALPQVVQVLHRGAEDGAVDDDCGGSAQAGRQATRRVHRQPLRGSVVNPHWIRIKELCSAKLIS